MNLTILNIPFKWNYTLSVLLWLLISHSPTFSTFIHVVTYSRISFWMTYTIPLHVCIVLFNTFLYQCTFTLSLYFGYHINNGITNIVVQIFLISNIVVIWGGLVPTIWIAVYFQKRSYGFQIWGILIHICVLFCYFVLSFFYQRSQLMCVISHCGFDLQFASAYWLYTSFHPYSLAILHASLWEMCFQDVWFYYYSAVNSLVFWILSLYQRYRLQIFSPLA